MANLLHVIPVNSDKDGMVSIMYDTPIYCKLAQNYISTIDILITNSLADSPIDFQDNEVIIGLTFRCTNYI